jgi:hypothetical protein
MSWTSIINPADELAHSDDAGRILIPVLQAAAHQ